MRGLSVARVDIERLIALCSWCMPRCVAFLRAINVGGRTVKMDYLRSLFEDLGFADVETFIASGNVVFESKSKGVEALAKKIESRLGGALGYEVATFLRTDAQIARASRRFRMPCWNGRSRRGEPCAARAPSPNSPRSTLPRRIRISRRGSDSQCEVGVATVRRLVRRRGLKRHLDEAKGIAFLGHHGDGSRNVR